MSLFTAAVARVKPARLLLPCLALLAVGAGVFRSRSHAAAPPAGAPPVADAIARLGWAPYVVAVRNDGDLRSGAYLSTHPLSDLAAVRRLNTNLPDEWRGIVRVTPYSTAGQSAEEFSGWGERARVVGPLLLYGDPELVARAATELGR
jgi:hypothetical protein